VLVGAFGCCVLLICACASLFRGWLNNHDYLKPETVVPERVVNPSFKVNLII
jgi:hypothetical protein